MRWTFDPEETAPSTPGALLRLVGMTLITTVGGASGPLYGAAFTAAGIAAHTNATLTIADLASCARSAADAVGQTRQTAKYSREP